MGRISDCINQNMSKIRHIYIRYAASIFCALIIAVVNIIAKKEFDIDLIVSVCLIWLAGNFLIESLWKKTLEEAQKTDILEQIFYNILYFYIVCAVLLAIYVLFRQQQLDLPHCIGRIIFSLLRVVGVYLVLNIAVFLILGIIEALLFEIDIFEVETNIQILLSALAYFPTFLLAVSDTSEDNAAFTKKFVSYVLLPCVWIAKNVHKRVYADEVSTTNISI